MKNSNGYGNIHDLGKRRRKRYGVRVTLNYDDEGKQIRKYIGYFSTIKEANKFLADYNEDHSIATTITLEQIFYEWKKVKYPNISEKSQAMYDNAWNKLSQIAHNDIKTIKTPHLQEIISKYSNLSVSSLKDIKSLASQLYDYSIMNDYSNKNYAKFLELKKETRKEKKVFSEIQIQQMWENINLPWMDSILFMIYTGMRVGEMLTLTKFDINIKEWTIQHGNKTEAGKNRIIPIHPKIVPLIKKRMSDNSEYIFSKENNKISTDHYRRQIFYPLLKELNISDEFTPHNCRHTFATRLSASVDNKVLIQKLMGHTDYSITANIYTHSDIIDLQKAVSSIE